MMSRQDWIASMIARLEPRAAALRVDGTRAGPTIAGCIEDMLARLRADIATAPPPIADDEPISWRSPMFNAGGVFDPFAGEKWQRMLASAATCERLGEHQAAEGFRKAATSFRADVAEPAVALTPAIVAPAGSHVARPRPQRARETWSGPPMPPAAMPAPFAAGPQLGLFG